MCGKRPVTRAEMSGGKAVIGSFGYERVGQWYCVPSVSQRRRFERVCVVFMGLLAEVGSFGWSFVS